MSDILDTSEPPRVLADAMLGKLARWLRVLGYDARYLQGEDAYIASQARAEGRVLLTRDHELSRRRGLDTILIASQSLPEQIAQVVAVLGLPSDAAAPRCMACNAPLYRITVEEARPHVPRYTAKTHDVFHRCPKCGKIYWRGTHWADMERRIREALASVS